MIFSVNFLISISVLLLFLVQSSIPAHLLSAFVSVKLGLSEEEFEVLAYWGKELRSKLVLMSLFSSLLSVPLISVCYL